MNKIYTTCYYTTCYLTVFILVLFASANVSAQNMGFEQTPAVSPPTNWTAVSGTWTINTTTVRTGAQSMQIIDPATTGSTMGNTNPWVNTTAPGYLITIGWGRATTDNALINFGYRSGTTNTMNPSSTSSGQTPNLNSTSWTRLTSVSASGTLAAGNYGSALRAFRSATTPATTLYIDDIITYASSSNIVDLSAPEAATNPSIAVNLLNWTNGVDNGSPASGIGGVIIIRADGIGLTAPTLNDQAMYATTTGEAGTSSFLQNGNTWTVIASITGNATTSFTDGTAGAGPYTYAIFMRDMAYNYSTATTVTFAQPCTEPPTAGTFNPSPATAVCSGAPVTLGLLGGTGGTGQTYQWQSSSTIGGIYTNISPVQQSPSFVINPTTTMYYKAEIICSAGAPVYSTPGQVIVTPAFSGTYTINSAIATGGSNFQTFAAAVAAMSACGINGPVVFNVDAASGPYTEQITIPAINGSSVTNTVTFNGNGRTLQFTPVTAARHILKLDGADYITFNNLNITGLATDFDWGVHLTNAADSNTFNNCTIDLSANTSTTQSNSAGIVASNSTTSVVTTGNNASYLTVTGCTIIGGYQGIILNGLATSLNAINNTITNNTIRDMHGNGIELVQNDGAMVSGNNISRAIRTTMFSTSAGIEIGAGCKNVIVNANKIHDTHTSVVTQTGTAYGIYFNACDAPAGSENRVTNNLIYNFNSGSGTQYGLYNSSSDGVYYFHNTVVLDNAASTAGTTYAFYQTTLASNIQLRNNILYVTRGGTGLKNCMRFNTATSTIISDNNVLYINSGAGTVGVGYYAANFVTLADWKTANGNAYDQQSVAHNPQFASAIDFTPTNPLVDNIGANVGVATDIMGNPRTLASPDPGAYEWNSGVDLVLPSISYTTIENTICTTDRTLSATITDVSGVNITTGTKPRLYFKKSTDANTYVGNTNADNGWKYVEASNASSPFSFTSNFALLQTAISAGDIIQYFVVAQDLAPTPNVGINSGTFAATPISVALTSAAFPIGGTINQYTLITGALASDVTIGAAGTYPTLTGVGGLFEAINAGGITNNITASVLDAAITETGAISLNAINYGCAGTYTLLIKPAAGVTTVISGTVATTSMINLNGADNVTFDGSNNGTSSKDMTFRNLSTSGAVIRFINDATFNTVKNSILEAATTTTTTGVLSFSTSTGTLGNSNNTIMNNDIRDRSDAIALFANGIYSSGSAGAPNASNTISGNNIFNFTANGMNLTSTGIGNSWQITGNSFYNDRVTPPATAQTSILVSGGSSHLISGNFIGGNAANASGSAWSNTGNVAFTGINLAGVGAAGAVSVQNNTIQNISLTATGSGAFNGILVSGASTVNAGTVTGNTIGHALTANSIQTSALSPIIGINSTSTAPVNFSNNTVANITSTGATTAVGVRGISHTGSGTLVINNNTIQNISAANATASQTTSALLGIYTSSTTVGQMITGNTISGLILSHPTAANYVQAINLNNSTTANVGTVSGNKIFNIQNTSTGSPFIIGIDHLVGSWNVHNNFISLDNGSNTNAVIVRGIWDWPGATYTSNVYYNTVYVAGSSAAGAANSYAYQRSDGGTSVVKDNIFYNARTGGTGNHFSVSDTNTIPGTLLTSNFNDLFAVNPATVGEWGIGVTQDFAQWKVSSGGDANSISVQPVFISSTDLHLDPANNSALDNLGDPVTGITIDIDGQTRGTGVVPSPDAPDMGADEFAGGPVPVTLVYFKGSKQNNGHLLDWKVNCYNSPSVTLILERSADGRKFTSINNQTETSLRCLQPFSYTDAAPLSGINYYRLKSIDIDGKETYSNIVALLNKEKGFEMVSLVPNPVKNDAVLSVTSAVKSSIEIVVSDLSGKQLYKQRVSMIAGNNQLPLNVRNLPAGIYQVTGITADGVTRTLRFVKQ